MTLLPAYFRIDKMESIAFKYNNKKLIPEGWNFGFAKKPNLPDKKTTHLQIADNPSFSPPYSLKTFIAQSPFSEYAFSPEANPLFNYFRDPSN